MNERTQIAIIKAKKGISVTMGLISSDYAKFRHCTIRNENYQLQLKQKHLLFWLIS